MAKVHHVHLRSLSGLRLRLVSHWHEDGGRTHGHQQEGFHDYAKTRTSLLRGRKVSARKNLERRLAL